MSDEMPVEKRCIRCDEVKPIEEFHKHKKQKDGHHYYCKKCIAARQTTTTERKREYNRAYHKAHAEERREYNRTYQAANVEKIRELKRAYREANADAIREYNRAYHEANRDKIAERIRTQRAANPEKQRERMKAWRDANPDKIREYSRLYYSSEMNKTRYTANPDLYAVGTHRRRAKRYGATGSFTIQQLRAMRKAQDGICIYCQIQHSPYHLTIDHIIPMSRGGSNDISNISLACRTCNFSKNDKLLSEWIDRWYEHGNGKGDSPEDKSEQ